MGGQILGRAFVKGRGLHFVEQTDAKDHFRLRSMRDGASLFVHRSHINWR